MRIIIANPVTVMFGMWLLVISLYSLNLSYILRPSFWEVLVASSTVLLGFVITYLFVSSVAKFKAPDWRSINIKINSNILLYLFMVWIIINICQVITSKGIPLEWLIIGIDKTYFDYGIHSLNGFSNGILSLISTISFYDIVKNKKKSLLRLIILFSGLLWPIIIISRELMLVNLLQMIFVYFLTKKINKRAYIYFFIILLLFIFCFGIIGDFRTGYKSFMSLAEFRGNNHYRFLSGFYWAYMYLATPIANFANTTAHAVPIYNLLMPNTLSLLLPSVIRDYFFTNASFGGFLISKAFNVSTAFASSYLDMGFIGVLLYSGFLGFYSAFCYHKKTGHYLFINSIVLQCLCLSIFFNQFLYLPVLSQIFWLYLLRRKLVVRI